MNTVLQLQYLAVSSSTTCIFFLCLSKICCSVQQASWVAVYIKLINLSIFHLFLEHCTIGVGFWTTCFLEIWLWSQKSFDAHVKKALVPTSIGRRQCHRLFPFSLCAVNIVAPYRCSFSCHRPCFCLSSTQFGSLAFGLQSLQCFYQVMPLQCPAPLCRAFHLKVQCVKVIHLVVTF